MARTPDRSDRADRSDGGKTGSQELARILRERREELGMSRQDLADATGIPYPTVAQIETAYRGVSPARLGVIARVLGLDPKDLYDVLASEGAADSGCARLRPPDRARRSAGRSADLGERAPATEPAGTPTRPLRQRCRWPTRRRLRSRLLGCPTSGRRSRSGRKPPHRPPARASGSARPTDNRSTPDDVVSTVVDLLATLPPDQRIGALGRVQNLLLERLLAERWAGDE